MRAFLIEDEPVAQWILEDLLREVAPRIEICGKAGTVTEAVAWFEHNQADLVFMDVELADGNCFDILAETEIRGQIIMITAYDHYAYQACSSPSKRRTSGGRSPAALPVSTEPTPLPSSAP